MQISNKPVEGSEKVVNLTEQNAQEDTCTWKTDELMITLGEKMTTKSKYKAAALL